MHYIRSGTFRLEVANGKGVAYKQNRTTGRLFEKQFNMRNV